MYYVRYIVLCDHDNNIDTTSSVYTKIARHRYFIDRTTGQ